jgi:hypothetical protein
VDFPFSFIESAGALAKRAIILITSYDFDMISLDFELAGPGSGVEVASVIEGS